MGAVVGLVSALSSRRGYSDVGAGPFAVDRQRHSQAGQGVNLAEAEDEIRQLVKAKSDRRTARGEAPLDVEAEVAAQLKQLQGDPGDDDLREEVRQLVIARNERRLARGEQALDVEAEVARELERLSGRSDRQ